MCKRMYLYDWFVVCRLLKLTTALVFSVQACWVLNYFSRISFKNEANLQRAVEAVRVCLLHDKELPVKVEAALALQFFIKRQDKG